MSKSLPYAISPLLASKTPVLRSRVLVGLMAAAFLGLACRAAWVQVLGNDFFRKQGEVRFARTLDLPAHRGQILDRNGLVLAASVPAPSIWAFPEDVADDVRAQGAEGTRKLQRLAQLLDMPMTSLKAKLADDDRSFVWLKRQVDEAVAEQVTTLGLKGIYQRKEYRREYPEAEATAHVLGFTNVEDKGQEGIELAFQQELLGTAGSRKVIKNRLGQVVEDAREQVAPVDGRDVQLSIDSKVQFFAWQKLREAAIQHKAKAGSVVVMDVPSGEILALANYPAYAPKQKGKVDAAVLRNRAVTDTFEPGSTMKPLIAALAIERGIATPETRFQTAPGRIQIAGATITDSHAHGVLSLKEIIQKSSNVGTVKLAMQLPSKAMWEMYHSVGLGQKPTLNFPGTVTGRLRPYASWKPIEQATMSYGYGLSASLLQLAQVYGAIARDGEYLPATLLKTKTDGTGESAPERQRVMSAKTAQSVREMLHMATMEGGTAPQAQTDGYTVGGKTGTAHKQEGKGYASKKYRSFFVGMAPIKQPRIVVAVMLDEPSNGKYFGGEVAGPVFSNVVQQSLRLLGMPPDMNVKMQALGPAVEESF
jgi:cell division protein FtsI (penicillin-binding protein 3)